MALDDLTSEVGAGDDGYLAWGCAEQLVDDLTHALTRADFDSLDERDDDGRFWDERLPVRNIGPHHLRRDSQHYVIGSLQRFLSREGRPHFGREFDTRVVRAVLMDRRDLLDGLRVPGPHGDLTTGVREHHGKRGAPRSGSHHGYSGHWSSSSKAPVDSRSCRRAFAGEYRSTGAFWSRMPSRSSVMAWTIRSVAISSVA